MTDEKGEDMEHNIQLTFRVTVELDEKWASNQTTDEVIEYIKQRMNSSLGFRGQIRKFSVVRR
jgi:hypothetical protein